ncbi:hypothetical protein Cgig2_028838 [Carnegiea gigantea]|uniref:Uncharacterized protein n=1 Tax=Carnegiea gigantea TaxID=171969 RepID=A0A9Q1KSQ5_9CARY|nr:hypothetical protein Cgig2_028838 [Carnegiea gigantea]
MDNRKFDVDKWKNGVGERIEKKLKKTYKNMGSVVELRGLPCVHAMAVIEREKLYVYDYVNPCYKAPTQRTIYMNVIHPMKTHDMRVVDSDTGLIVGGNDLYEDFNRRILPPRNPPGAGRPRKRRVESHTQGLKPRRCSKCGDLGRYKSTCRNPRADFDADYPGDVIPLEAKIVKHHDNYRRRYACRPKQGDYACGYFEEVDPQYPNRAMEVIDDLVAEMREARNVLLEERNNQYWMEEEDRTVEDGMRAELNELKGVVGVAFVAIVVLVAALLVMWSF